MVRPLIRGSESPRPAATASAAPSSASAASAASRTRLELHPKASESVSSAEATLHILSMPCLSPGRQGWRAVRAPSRELPTCGTRGSASVVAASANLRAAASLTAALLLAVAREPTNATARSRCSACESASARASSVTWPSRPSHSIAVPRTTGSASPRQSACSACAAPAVPSASVVTCLTTNSTSAIATAAHGSSAPSAPSAATARSRIATSGSRSATEPSSVGAHNSCTEIDGRR